ncbi:MAG: methionine--tRNA ligase [Candidatus Micrarchaeia archaeon]
MSKVIITAALPYAYSIPHLGNLVGAFLPADIYYKYLKMNGDDVIYICGSDQHGTPIELKAIKNNVDPEKLADDMHNEIKQIFDRFELTFTKYGKTHTKENKETVYEIFNALYKNNLIKEVKSIQPYCNIDKRFITERFIEGTCPYCGGHARGDQCTNCNRLLTPQELIDPHCVICGKNDIAFLEEKNLAFELDKLELELRAFIARESPNDWTKNAINKSTSFIDEGLHAREITRMMKWGFPVPLKGYEDYVFYVWFDALIGYIGITKEWDHTRWKDYWMDRNTRLVQFMGKDNLEFHTLMWPAILIGSKLGFILPKTVKVSEFLTAKGVKFSKSEGVGLNMKVALDIAEADYWRFVLMYIYPENADSEFSIEIFEEIVNKIMNDKIGNLINRVLTIASRNYELIKDVDEIMYKEEIERLEAEYVFRFESISLREALHVAIELAELGNNIMSRHQPWVLAKNALKDPNSKDSLEFSNVIKTELVLIYKLAILLYPFTPKTSMKILSYFGINDEPKLEMLNADINDIKISKDIKPELLFSKLSKEQIEKLEKLK